MRIEDGGSKIEDYTDNAIFDPRPSILGWVFNLMRGIGAAWRWPDRERGRGFAPSLMAGLPPRSVG